MTLSPLYDARLVAHATPEAIVSADDGGRIVFWNAAAERLFGYLEADALGEMLSVLISDNPQSVERALADAGVDAAAVPHAPVELPGLRRDGTRFRMAVAASQWQRGTARYVTAVIRDVSVGNDSEGALRQSEERFRTLVERSPEAIVLHAGGAILYANPAFAAMIGAQSAEELAGLHVVDLVHPESRSLLARRQQQEGDSASRFPAAYRVMHRDGRTLAVEATTVPSVYNGRPARQTHLRDVTAQRELEAELAHQAFHDAVTGLSNRSLFRNRVEHAIERASRTGSPPAVLFLDLDNFKSFNDGLGHSAGDELLVAVARRLQVAMRGSDTCARLGGDEFAVLIEEARTELDVVSNAAHVASRLISALAAPCNVGGEDVVVTVSIGIAVATHDETVDDLLRNADVAMYRAKAGGKGRFELFRPEMHELVRRRLDLETDLRRAVDDCADPARSQFFLEYQPIAALESGRIEWFEALVRWQHPRLGVVSPADFIPICEETGLIVSLGSWILRQACAQAKRWHDEGIGGEDASHVGVSVNLSVRQVVHPEFIRDVSAALAETGLRRDALLLEVTESLFLDSSEMTLTRLAALKELGVRVALDDFGTGYSSLAYLERFRVDLLKIDGSFVERVGARNGESPLARAIIGLGHELRMRVVAEGIETAAQWARLREFGCDLGQGYYVGRPAIAGAIPRVAAF